MARYEKEKESGKELESRILTRIILNILRDEHQNSIFLLLLVLLVPATGCGCITQLMDI